MYSEEEMVASGAIPATYEAVDPETGEVLEKLDYIKITQEQQPARLLHVIKRTRTPASGLLQDIVDRLENARRRQHALLFSRILRHLHRPALIYSALYHWRP